MPKPKQLRVTVADLPGRPEHTSLHMEYGPWNGSHYGLGLLEVHKDDFADFVVQLRDGFGDIKIAQAQPKSEVN